MKSVIYVGMDVHKETIAIAVLRDNQKNVEFERQIRNEPGQIKRFFKKLKEKSETILSCYEAGPTGYVLYRLLAVCRTLPLSKKKNFQNSISRIKFLHECKFYKY